MVKKAIFILFLITACVTKLNGQTRIITVEDGDTISMILLDPIEVVAQSMFLTPEELAKNAKLIRNVKKVYPFAVTAQKKLAEYNDILSKTPNEKQRKEIMKKAEKEIEAEFGVKLKKLNFSQGRILIKLIDRETGNSSYYLVEELRGKFRAFFYQTFARIFGFNLKSRYNPKTDKEDQMIEKIVLSIIHNQI